jgi:hypothetical protein
MWSTERLSQSLNGVPTRLLLTLLTEVAGRDLLLPAAAQQPAGPPVRRAAPLACQVYHLTLEASKRPNSSNAIQMLIATIACRDNGNFVNHTLPSYLCRKLNRNAGSLLAKGAVGLVQHPPYPLEVNLNSLCRCALHTSPYDCQEGQNNVPHSMHCSDAGPQQHGTSNRPCW